MTEQELTTLWAEIEALKRPGVRRCSFKTGFSFSRMDRGGTLLFDYGEAHASRDQPLPIIINAMTVARAESNGRTT
jgi:hypothetical protein